MYLLIQILVKCSLRIRERPRSLLEHGECQEAESEDRLNSKGLWNGESRRYSLRVESLTSRQNTDRLGTGTTAARKDEEIEVSYKGF